MNPFDQAWVLLKMAGERDEVPWAAINDPDGEDGKFQCTSCEKMFDMPHVDEPILGTRLESCPHCYGNHWVEGSIDDPWTENELREMEEEKAMKEQMKRQLFGISGSTPDLPDAFAPVPPDTDKEGKPSLYYSKDFEEQNQ